MQTKLKVYKIFVLFYCLSLYRDNSYQNDLYQKNFVSKWPLSLQTASCTFSPKISTFQLKRLCHGRLVHFLNNITYTSLNVMELMLCVDGKITASCLSGSTSNVTNKAHELWKNVRLTSFHNTFLFQSSSLSICSSFCILLCYLYLLFMPWAVILHFT